MTDIITNTTRILIPQYAAQRKFNHKYGQSEHGKETIARKSQRYYNNHKELIAQRRKDKYDNDPEYRDKLKQQAKERYNNKKNVSINQPNP